MTQRRFPAVFMRGGISSLSKVCVIAPSRREDADIDYTFAQVQVKEARIEGTTMKANGASALELSASFTNQGDALPLVPKGTFPSRRIETFGAQISPRTHFCRDFVMACTGRNEVIPNQDFRCIVP